MRAHASSKSFKTSFEDLDTDSSHHCIVYPSSPLRVAWDAMLLLLLMVLLFVLPLRFGFSDERLGGSDMGVNEQGWAMFDYFVLGIFTMDIVINFRTGVVIDTMTRFA